MELYIFSPFGPTCWFCNLVLTKSSGKTQDTPMIPAIPPFMILGTNLKLISGWGIVKVVSPANFTPL